MNKNSMSKRVMCLVVIGSMIIPNAVYAQELVNKDESVFVNLSEKGNIKDEVVSEWLHSENALSNINDRSDLRNIKNIKGTEKPRIDADNLTWNSEKKDLFYQGTTDKELPLKIDVKYYLNDKEMNPQNMGGKSGNIKIKIHFTNMESKMVTIKGKDKKIYTPFSTLTLVTLPNDVFTKVQVNNGKVMSEGNNNIVNFLSFPGLKESLDIKDKDLNIDLDKDLPEDLEITAKTNKFKLGPIFITATPQLPDIKEIDEASNLDELKDGIQKLKDSAQKLCEGTLKLSDGSKQLGNALHQLKDGISGAKDGVRKAKGEMAKNSDKLDLVRVPSNVKAENKLIDDSFMAMNMDTSLVKTMTSFITPENKALFDKISSNLPKIGSIMNNPLLAQLSDKKMIKLYKDSTNLLSNLDMNKLQPVLELSGTTHELLGLMNNSQDVLKQVPLVKKMVNDKTLIERAKSLENINLNPIIELLNDKQVEGIKKLIDEKVPIIQNIINNQIEKSQKFVEIANGKGGLIDDKNKFALENNIMKSNLDRETKEKMILITELTFNTKSNMIQSQGIMNNMLSEVQKLNELKNKLTAIQNKVLNVKTNITGKVKDFQDMKKDINELLESKEINNLKSSLQKLQSNINNPKTQEAISKIQNANKSGSFEYLKKLQPQLEGIKSDLYENSKVIDSIKTMLQKDNGSKISEMLSSLQSLKQDANNAQATIKKIETILTPDKIKKIPDMTNQLLSMQQDLTDNKKILEVMKDALSKGNVSMANNLLNSIPRLTDGVNKLADGVDKIVDGGEKLTDGSGQLNDGMNKFNEEGIKKIDSKVTPKIDNLEETIDIKDSIVNLSKEYKTFTGIGDNMNGNVKFIMKTDEIKIPQEKHKVKHEVKKEKMNFFQWIKSLF